MNTFLHTPINICKQSVKIELKWEIQSFTHRRNLIGNLNFIKPLEQCFNKQKLSIVHVHRIGTNLHRTTFWMTVSCTLLDDWSLLGSNIIPNWNYNLDIKPFKIRIGPVLLILYKYLFKLSLMVSDALRWSKVRNSVNISMLKNYFRT